MLLFAHNWSFNRRMYFRDCIFMTVLLGLLDYYPFIYENNLKAHRQWQYVVRSILDEYLR